MTSVSISNKQIWQILPMEDVLFSVRKKKKRMEHFNHVTFLFFLFLSADTISSDTCRDMSMSAFLKPVCSDAASKHSLSRNVLAEPDLILLIPGTNYFNLRWYTGFIVWKLNSMWWCKSADLDMSKTVLFLVTYSSSFLTCTALCLNLIQVGGFLLPY